MYVVNQTTIEKYSKKRYAIAIYPSSKFKYILTQEREKKTQKSIFINTLLHISKYRLVKNLMMDMLKNW